MDDTDAALDRGVRLLTRPERDAFAVLGIQAEQLDIAAQRLEEQLAPPPWSDQDAYTKVLTAQRAGDDQIAIYATRGRAFITDVLSRCERQLRGALCAGAQVRPELASHGDEAKETIRQIAGVVAAIALTNVPAPVAAAIAGISTTIAIILVKRGMEHLPTN